eukprot:TRINITY_DN7257_c0_g1_i2.p1 TRINITY_DN7257_c0_g1~~TRINITY_DN7257_c0_g1_i2.p1  ORF type:complete len:295 (-),score=91.75 TRINITY_DN7257_c0_g1_i2:89-973(-)
MTNHNKMKQGLETTKTNIAQAVIISKHAVSESAQNAASTISKGVHHTTDTITSGVQQGLKKASSIREKVLSDESDSLDHSNSLGELSDALEEVPDCDSNDYVEFDDGATRKCYDRMGIYEMSELKGLGNSLKESIGHNIDGLSDSLGADVNEEREWGEKEDKVVKDAKCVFKVDSDASDYMSESLEEPEMVEEPIMESLSNMANTAADTIVETVEATEEIISEIVNSTSAYISKTMGLESEFAINPETIVSIPDIRGPVSEKYFLVDPAKHEISEEREEVSIEEVISNIKEPVY